MRILSIGTSSALLNNNSSIGLLSVMTLFLMLVHSDVAFVLEMVKIHSDEFVRLHPLHLVRVV